MKGRLREILDRIQVFKSNQSSIIREKTVSREEIFEKIVPEFPRIEEIFKYISMMSTIYISRENLKKSIMRTIKVKLQNTKDKVFTGA